MSKKYRLLGFWQLPALFNGTFINLKYNAVPDEEYDIIFAAIEKDSNNLDTIKKLYPDARIFGCFKEIWNQNIDVRNYVIDNTEGFISPYTNIDIFDKFGLNRPIYDIRIPQPIDIDYLQTKFNCKKENKIFLYSNTWAQGRSSNWSEKFLQSLPYEYKTAQSVDDPYRHTETWKECKFMINLDPTTNYGIQSLQCAALGTIMIGSNNDCQKELFPDLVGTDESYLLDKLSQLINDKKYYETTLKYANNLLYSKYSMDVVKTKIEKL
tara:strand:+ start:128 stop:928 length:801 start_codon:yes stop_codon:yes gene_type:complete